MENNTEKVIKACNMLARKGNGDIDVFDLMYETSLAYSVLKTILDRLVSENGLAAKDIKTYIFTGNTDVEQSDAHSVKIGKYGNIGDIYTREYPADEYINGEKENAFVEDTDSGELFRDEENELNYRALKLCIERGCVSASMLQRSLPVGYITACKILDWMENMGYVTDGAGGEARKILLTMTEYEQIVKSEEQSDDILYVLDGDESERDEELDEKFAEYERYIREHLYQEEERVKEESLSKEATVNCIKQILQKKNMNNPSEDMPPRLVWEDKDKFMNAVCDRLMKIMSPAESGSRAKAVKKAEQYLIEARKNKHALFTELYERVVYELRSMSNYYYNKIREYLV